MFHIFKDLRQHVRHHNSNVRKDAIIGLKEIISQQNQTQIKADLKIYVESLIPLISDVEPEVRKSTLTSFKIILEKVEPIDIAPMFHLIVAHLVCASTDLNPKKKLFSVKFLELLVDFLPDLCKGNWSLLKSYADLLNFKDNSVDKSRKLTFLQGLFRILDLNYRKIEEKRVENSDYENLQVSKTINSRFCTFIPKNSAPFDFPVVSAMFWTAGSCDEINNAGNLNYILNRIIPFCHSFWVEITTSDSDASTVSGHIFDLDTLKIMMTILKVYILLIDRVKSLEDALDIGIEDISLLKTSFGNYFDKGSFVRHYWDHFPYQMKRMNSGDVEKSDICATLNLLICELYSSSSVLKKAIGGDKVKIETFLQKLVCNKKIVDAKIVFYVQKIASIYDIHLENDV